MYLMCYSKSAHLGGTGWFYEAHRTDKCIPGEIVTSHCHCTKETEATANAVHGYVTGSVCGICFSVNLHTVHDCSGLQ